MLPVKIGVLISGGGTNLQAVIDSLEKNEIKANIELVISNKEEAYGLTRAKNHDIEAKFIDIKDFEDEESYNLELIKEFKRAGVELVLLAGYLRVLSSSFIDAFRNRIINIHPSLIPSFCGKGYYGKKVHQAAIDYGVKLTGATVHFVDEGTDTGPIILQDVVRVYPEDNADDLQKRVLNLEHKLLVEAVRLYCEGRIKVDGRKVSIKEG